MQGKGEQDYREAGDQADEGHPFEPAAKKQLEQMPAIEREDREQIQPAEREVEEHEPAKELQERVGKFMAGRGAEEKQERTAEEEIGEGAACDHEGLPQAGETAPPEGTESAEEDEKHFRFLAAEPTSDEGMAELVEKNGEKSSGGKNGHGGELESAGEPAGYGREGKEPEVETERNPERAESFSFQPSLFFSFHVDCM